MLSFSLFPKLFLKIKYSHKKDIFGTTTSPVQNFSCHPYKTPSKNTTKTTSFPCKKKSTITAYNNCKYSPLQAPFVLFLTSKKHMRKTLLFERYELKIQHFEKTPKSSALFSNYQHLSHLFCIANYRFLDKFLLFHSVRI